METLKAEKTRRKQELWGVLWGFGTAFVALCLFTFSPKDPCLFIREGATGPVMNLLGPVGATLSGWLFMLVGFSSWLLVPAMAAVALTYFRRSGEEESPGKHPTRLLRRGAGAVLLLVSAAVFLELAFGRVEMEGEVIGAGGIAGGFLGEVLAGLAGEAGALIIGLLLTVLALMAAFDFSPRRAGRALLNAFLFARQKASDYLTRKKEARRRREMVKEKQEEEKTRPQPQIRIVEQEKPKPASKAPPKPKQEKLPFLKEGEYELPPFELLDELSESRKKTDHDSLLMNARVLENKLQDFGVKGEVVEVHPGPVITMYEYRPASGVKINKISNLADDLAMALSAISVRIIAPIPGKDVVGIEISNTDRTPVMLREILESDQYRKSKSMLPIALGNDITGNPYAFDLKKAPHLLVAGATGTGKSVSLNAMIMSVLYRSRPDQVQLLMIDPKKLELSVYEGIPHLLHPVIADPKNAATALKWAVAEMEKRYALLAAQGVRNIDSYNRLAMKNRKEKNSKKKKPPEEEGDTVAITDQDTAGKESSKTGPPEEPMPLILVVIDELADLMMVAARDIEESICRLAQMARAAGIHLILATQRPSVDVITGLIKANFPSRIAFKVASRTDSRTILDQNGAERLLGQGDMLFLPPGTSQLIRLHGPYVSEEEIQKVVQHWQEQGEPDYAEEIIQPRPEDSAVQEEEQDEKYVEALRIVASTKQASISGLQRKLKIGYNRAARIIERMESEGVVGPSDGVKPREVYIDPMQLEQETG
ncbi:MAG: DNA translocase FtsK 4TM domain-containing protein [bacterium]